MMPGMELFGIPVPPVAALVCVFLIFLLSYTVGSRYMGFGVTRVEWEENGVEYRPPKTVWDSLAQGASPSWLHWWGLKSPRNFKAKQSKQKRTAPKPQRCRRTSIR
jgi:hypothetical protein